MPKNNFWVSIGLVLSLTAAVQPQMALAGQKYALLVGVNRYQHPRLTELRFCENDVSELAEVLQSGSYQVTVLRGDEATKGNIEQRLNSLLRAARADDSVIVAFAGHGLQFQQDAYFCPVDGRPFANETAGLISLTQVYQDIDRSFARVKVMLVDACRNDGTRGLRGVDGDNSPRPPRGVAALFSCAAGEVAHEHERFRHGIFFHYILQGLRGEARNAKGQITFASLVDYVSAEVAAIVPELIGEGARQSPNMKADLQGASPVLYFAGAPVAEKRDQSGEIAALQAKLEEQEKRLAELNAKNSRIEAQKPSYKEEYPKYENTKYDLSNSVAALAAAAQQGHESDGAIYKALGGAGIYDKDVESLRRDNGNQCFWVRVRNENLGSEVVDIYRVDIDDLRVSFYRREQPNGLVPDAPLDAPSRIFPDVSPIASPGIVPDVSPIAPPAP